MANWGFSLPEIFVANPHLTWISMTAYGRAGNRANWVGFGDDVAAAAGLCIESEGIPMFVGDAVADPLAGLAAAASAFACLAAGGGLLVDASLFASARYVASAPRLPDVASVAGCNNAWILQGDGWREAVQVPIATSMVEPARALGADNDAVLRELLIPAR
jgi:crotonobetainyl-CoA:carnitine CoA-transferase CaiB-like acyl-CoA transferase